MVKMRAGFKQAISEGSQAIALLAIAFSMVVQGAVDPHYQGIVCWMLAIALVLNLPWPSRSLGNQRWLVPVFVAWFAWLAFLQFQFTVVPSGVIARLAPYSNLIRTKFVDPETTIYNTLSLVPGAGQVEWPLYAIGCGFMILGAVAFSSRLARRRLWWFMAITGMVLPILAGGSKIYLVAAGFGKAGLSLITGNPLSAMLVLSLACLIGCLFEWMQPAVREQIKRVAKLNQIPVRIGRRPVREGLQQLDRRTVWNQPKAYLFLGAIGYLCISIGWTGSLLFCSGVLTTMLIWAIAVRRLIPTPNRSTLLIVLGILLLAMATQLVSLIAGQASEAGNSLKLSEQLFHWSDSIDAAFNSPKVGTGLGSYPYVHLLHLDFDSPHWIRDPRSMLLKWLVETGICGILILFLGGLPCLMLIRRLFVRRLAGTIFLASLSVGMICSLVLLIGSVLDSVVSTPLVLWSYALILGSVATTVSEPRINKVRSIQSGEAELSSAEPETIAHSPLLIRLIGRPQLWILLALIALLVSQPYLQRDIDERALLARVPLPSSDAAPTEDQSAEVRDLLSLRIARGTLNSSLYELLGHWELAEYRRDLLRRLAQQGTTLSWSESAPSALFYAYQRLSDDQQQAAVELWRGDQKSTALLDSALASFESSLALNPLQPSIHLLDALLSPITERNERRAIINAKRLAAGDADVRFEIGKIGWSIDDQQLMAEQWKRVIAKPSNHTLSILTMSLGKMQPEMIVDQIIADAGPERWAEIRDLCREHDGLKPLRPFVIRSTAATADG